MADSPARQSLIADLAESLVSRRGLDAVSERLSPLSAAWLGGLAIWLGLTAYSAIGLGSSDEHYSTNADWIRLILLMVIPASLFTSWIAFLAIMAYTVSLLFMEWMTPQRFAAAMLIWCRWAVAIALLGCLAGAGVYGSTDTEVQFQQKPAITHWMAMVGFDALLSIPILVLSFVFTALLGFWAARRTPAERAEKPQTPDQNR
ncbi:MAG: hypothetical protein AAGI68_09410 [Planctomycetota bacterium]